MKKSVHCHVKREGSWDEQPTRVCERCEEGYSVYTLEMQCAAESKESQAQGVLPAAASARPAAAHESAINAMPAAAVYGVAVAHGPV